MNRKVISILLGLIVSNISVQAAHAAARVKFIAIHCQDQQENTGPDEPYIKVAGRTFSCGKMSTGSTKQINQSRIPFSGRLTVELWEQDWPDRDDQLFGFEVNEAEKGGGTQRQTKRSQNGDTEYVLEYEVTD